MTRWPKKGSKQPHRSQLSLSHHRRRLLVSSTERKLPEQPDQKRLIVRRQPRLTSQFQHYLVTKLQRRCNLRLVTPPQAKLPCSVKTRQLDGASSILDLETQILTSWPIGRRRS